MIPREIIARAIVKWTYGDVAPEVYDAFPEADAILAALEGEGIELVEREPVNHQNVDFREVRGIYGKP